MEERLLLGKREGKGRKGSRQPPPAGTTGAPVERSVSTRYNARVQYPIKPQYGHQGRPMSQMDCALLELEQMCGDAVDLLLDRHEWRLLERAEFLRRMLEHLRAGHRS